MTISNFKKGLESDRTKNNRIKLDKGLVLENRRKNHFRPYYDFYY